MEGGYVDGEGIVRVSAVGDCGFYLIWRWSENWGVQRVYTRRGRRAEKHAMA